MGEAPADPFIFLVFAEECHIQRLQTSGAISGACKPALHQPNLRPNDPKTLRPSLVEKRHHQIRSFKIALGAKMKQSFIDGTATPPKIDSPRFANWKKEIVWCCHGC